MDSSTVIHYDDDEAVPVDLSLAEDALPSTDEKLQFDDDDPNLVSVFLRSEKGRQALMRIEEHIATEFQAEWDASAKWRALWMKNWKLFIGELPPKTGTFKDCANFNIPISLENTTRVAFRLHGEIFDDMKNVVTVAPVNKDDTVAVDLSKHFNWQLRNDIPDFERQTHRLCLAYTHIGDVPVHTYYDPELKQNRVEVLTPDEFIVPWTHTTTAPDYSDLPWLCKVCLLQTHELQKRRERWARIDEVLSDYQPTIDDEPEQGAASAVNRMQGQDENPSTSYAPHKVLWWEGWLELPGQRDQRFVQAHLHLKSRKLLALTIHEEPHWKDLARYEQQRSEVEAYEAARAAWEAERRGVESQLEEADAAVDLALDAGEASPDVAMEGVQMVEQRRSQIMPALDMAEPEPPPGMTDSGVTPPRRVPIHSFVHFVCIEPLVGNRGISYGNIQADLQRATNVLLSQFIDAGTFANIQTWAATRRFDSKGGLEWGPGHINYLEGMDVEDIRKVLMPMSVGQANPQLMDIANLLMEKATKSMQAAEILSGEPGKSGETYKGVAARIEQATKQLSVIGRKMGNGLRHVFRNLARLNAIYLEDDELIRIADLEGAPEVRVSAQMYQRSFSFEIRADMRFATNVQKIEEADEVLNMVMGLSAPGQPLMGNLAMQYECIKGAFLARRRPDLVALLGRKPTAPAQFGPPPPPPPAGGPGSSPMGPPGGGPMPGGQQ